MSFFRFLPGADALSAFRQQRLLASLAAQGVELESIEAQYLHFIWSESDLDVKNQEILASLLTYGQPFVSKLKSGNSWFSKGSKLCEDAVDHDLQWCSNTLWLTVLLSLPRQISAGDI